MPTYQYACTACDHRLEAVQSFTDDPLSECPECTGRLRKVFSAVGIVFKGSGFYRTDSRSGAAKGDAPAKPGGESSSGSDSSTSTGSEKSSSSGSESSGPGSSDSSSSSSGSSSGAKQPAAATNSTSSGSSSTSGGSSSPS